jgi:hypothetical protein
MSDIIHAVPKYVLHMSIYLQNFQLRYIHQLCGSEVRETVLMLDRIILYNDLNSYNIIE